MKEKRQILVVELLGGFGDVLLVLPAIHALARSHPNAEVCVLTFAPGHVLLRRDPLVAHAVPTSDHSDGAPLRAVEEELTRTPYDLVVTTTTYGGIPEACRRLAAEAVTDLWRDPPPDERVDRRFLRVLAWDGMIDERFVDEPLHVQLGVDEMVIGGHVVDRLAPAGTPVVLVPGSGMPVKQWPAARWSSLRPRSARLGTPSSSLVGPTSPGLRGRCDCRPATCGRWPPSSQRSACGAVSSSAQTPVRYGWRSRRVRPRSCCSGRPPHPLRRRPRACSVAAGSTRLRDTPPDVHRRAGVLVVGALPDHRRGTRVHGRPFRGAGALSSHCHPRARVTRSPVDPQDVCCHRADTNQRQRRS